jgi:branched-chain amino acid transport system substrate-binding protein
MGNIRRTVHEMREAVRIVTDRVPRKSNLRRWTRGVAAALAAVQMAGCTGADTVTLGASLPLTGNLAGTGRYYRDAYRFAVDAINEQGGVMMGEFRYRLALEIRDNTSDVNVGVRQYVDLVAKDRVNVLLGPYSSNAVLAVASIAEHYQVPMVQGGGASRRIFSRGNKYVFGTLPAAEDYFRSTIAMLQRLTPKAKTVALVSGDDEFDRAVANGTTALLKEAGLELVLNQEYSERTPNFSNIFTLIRIRAPDVIFWSGHETGGITFIRQSKSRNLHPNLLASYTVGVSTANFRAALGKDANYAFGMTPWLPTERLKDKWFGDADKFARGYEARFGYAPNYHAAAAVAAVQALAMAMEAAGTFESEPVREAITRLDFASIYGRVRFGEDGQIVLPQTVIQIQDDRVVEIFTDTFINQPIYPVPAWDKRS